MTRSPVQAPLAAFLIALLLTGCSDMPKQTVDPASVTQLAQCPSSPNCVCSQQDESDSHYIAPIAIDGDVDAAWQTLEELLEQDDSIEIIAAGDHYIRAVATTKILRFKDDVEFLLRRDAGEIDMRSASRVGYSDLGKNRKRMESIREALIEAGAATGAD